jgi:agmatine/peptidylarginine deiminase
VTPVPAYVDGGNLLVAGDVCVTTGPVGGTPKIPLDPSRPGLTKATGAALGCREVIVLDSPPHAHIDMWAKAVSDREILVSTVTEKTLSVARSSGSLHEAILIKDALNRMAHELAKTFTVTRIPLPLPYRGVFRTYTNAILVNGTAVVPRYVRFGWNYDDYPDKALEPYYEAEAAKAYAAAGFKPRFINADGMIFNGGAFHCVTVALPKPNGQPSPQKGH